MDCNGSCAGCPGCDRALVLTEGEMEFLKELGQWAFLPVARAREDPTPIYPEGGALGETSLLLQCLEKKGLISLDFDQPLKGFSGAGYEAYPIVGSMGLTARGQQVLELLEYQGFQEEGDAPMNGTT